MFNRRIELFLLVGALALFVPPATADATPAAGVDTRQLITSSDDGRDYIVRDITLNPGETIVRGRPKPGLSILLRRAEPVHQPQLIALKAKVLTDMGVGSVRVHPRHRHW